MFSALKTFLFGPSKAQRIRTAQLIWRADVARFIEAKRRGDTRAQHYAQRAARRAAQVALRLEIGR